MDNPNSRQQSGMATSSNRQLLGVIERVLLPVVQQLADPETWIAQEASNLQTGISHPGERFCQAVTPELQVTFSGPILEKYGQEITSRARSGTH